MVGSGSCAAKCCSPKARMGCGAWNILTSTFVLIYACMEQSRYKPFFTPIECTIPLPSADGTQLTNACENPNEYSITTKKEDSMTNTYIQAFSTTTSERYLFHIGHGAPSHDVVLQANGACDIVADVFLNLTAMQTPAFAGIIGSLFLQGYSPMYTHTISTDEVCMTIMGLPLCSTATSDLWCGWLSGPCFVPGPNDSAPPAFNPTCVYTGMVCSPTEEEMLKWATPEHLGLAVIGQDPCPAHTGLPASLNCSVVSAPFIDTNMVQQPISGFVEVRLTEEARKAAKGAETVVTIFTSVVIAVSALVIVYSLVDVVRAFRAWKTVEVSGPPASIAASGLPTVLASNQDQDQKGARPVAV